MRNNGYCRITPHGFLRSEFLLIFYSFREIKLGFENSLYPRILIENSFHHKLNHRLQIKSFENNMLEIFSV